MFVCVCVHHTDGGHGPGGRDLVKVEGRKAHNSTEMEGRDPGGRQTRLSASEINGWIGSHGW